jgi:hypothetical protein
MKAIVQDGYGLREIDKPLITDDSVLVRVRAASANALDWHTVHGGRLVRAIAFLLRQRLTCTLRCVEGDGQKRLPDRLRKPGSTHYNERRSQ